MDVDSLSTEVIRHPLIADIAQAKLTLRQLSYVFSQYKFYCEKFPSFLNLISDRFSAHREVAVLRENLAEELGLTNAGVSHLALFEKFIGSIEAHLEERKPHVRGSAVSEYISKLDSFLAGANFFESLGAIGPGTEEITPKQYSHILTGLKRYANSTFDTEFFSVHISGDRVHAEEIRRCFQEVAKTDHESESFLRGAERALILEKCFWDELQIEMALHE
jgi:pyrroloquinoline quinone (PQQ) biosynthesis protein C